VANGSRGEPRCALTLNPERSCAVNVSTTIPTTVQIRRGHLLGLIAAAVALAAAITWLLVAIAFDSGAPPTHQRVSGPGAVTPTAIPSTAYPPNYRGMP
jgi:hypothetical protein